MARTDITVKQLAKSTPITDLFTGVTVADNVNGMQFTATGKRRLLVNNGSAGPVDVTVATAPSNKVDGLTIPDRVVTIPAGKIGAVTETSSARQADGKVYVNFSVGPLVLPVVVEDA